MIEKVKLESPFSVFNANKTVSWSLHFVLRLVGLEAGEKLRLYFATTLYYLIFQNIFFFSAIEFYALE